LRGNHNLYNIGTALIASQLVGCDSKDAVQSVYEFKGLEHRLEFFGSFSGIDFYNDSISTIPQATTAAIKAFDNKLGSLVLGGYFRGDEIVWTVLTDELKKSQIDNIFFLPETGKLMFEDFINSGFKLLQNDDEILIVWDDIRIRCFFCSDFDEMVPLIFKHTPKNSICLLSPASSSYNMFKNFEERGKIFKESIKRYTSGDNND